MTLYKEKGILLLSIVKVCTGVQPSVQIYIAYHTLNE